MAVKIGKKLKEAADRLSTELIWFPLTADLSDVGLAELDFTKEEMIDPWGNRICLEWRFERSAEPLRIMNQFHATGVWIAKVTSLGSDGKPGGQGAAEDLEAETGVAFKVPMTPEEEASTKAILDEERRVEQERAAKERAKQDAAERSLQRELEAERRRRGRR